jgi:AcrR family transcriptional regulator
MTIRVQKREFAKQAILGAALSQITSDGMHGFSLRKLAREVGYSPASLYEYFDGKDAIVQELGAEGDRLLKERLELVSKDLPPDQRIVELGLAYIGFARTYPKHFELMFSELVSTKRSLKDSGREDKPYYILVGAVHDAVDQGLFTAHPDLDIGEIAYALWSLAHGAAMLQSTKLSNFKEEFPALDRAIFQTFIWGLGRKL